MNKVRYEKALNLEWLGFFWKMEQIDVAFII